MVEQKVRIGHSMKEIEDVLAEIRSAFDGDDLARKNSALRWSNNAIRDAIDRIAALEAQLATRTGGVKVEPLDWEDADEGMCTKWRAAALGGHYELVAFEKEPGFAVNFHWGRPLSFWFIQGEPDEWGPTGPKMFRTLEAAKAAAQADFERRVLSALSPAPEAQQEPVAWRDISTAPKNGTMLILLVQPGSAENDGWTPFADSNEPYTTIGFNALSNTGDDEWQFAGWNWCHDCFTDGAGTVIGWLPFEARPSEQAVTEAARAVLAEAEKMTMTMRRRAIFNALKAAMEARHD